MRTAMKQLESGVYVLETNLVLCQVLSQQLSHLSRQLTGLVRSVIVLLVGGFGSFCNGSLSGGFGSFCNGSLSGWVWFTL